jgi:hypothetical protein
MAKVAMYLSQRKAPRWKGIRTVLRGQAKTAPREAISILSRAVPDRVALLHPQSQLPTHEEIEVTLDPLLPTKEGMLHGTRAESSGICARRFLITG